MHIWVGLCTESVFFKALVLSFMLELGPYTKIGPPYFLFTLKLAHCAMAKELPNFNINENTIT